MVLGRKKKRAQEWADSEAAVIEAAAEQDLGEMLDVLFQQKHGISGSYKETGDVVYHFQQGFVDAPDGIPPAAVRFDQIVSVHQAFVQQRLNYVYQCSSYSFAIFPVVGERIDWNGEFWDPEVDRRPRGNPALPQFGRQLARDVSQARLPAALQALARGESQSFGNIVISPLGVRGQDGVVPWRLIAPLTFKNGAAHVFEAGQRKPLATAGMGSIPNLPLFLTLFDRLRQAAAA
jgi:hypothetical protein